MTVFEKIFKLLFDYYGPQGWWPLLKEINGEFICDYNTENSISIKEDNEKLEIALGAILTQNTTWKNAQRALINLKKTGLLDIRSLEKVEDKVLAEFIKPSGYYNQKARKIKEYIKFLNSGKEITRENLLRVWGLGPETVDDILLYAYDKSHFVIDTYTKRLFSRLGICNEKIDYHKLQDIIQNSIQKDTYVYKEYHALIVNHGKEYCTKKPKCCSCPLGAMCKATR
jgi:endonuclease-3 related protein